MLAFQNSENSVKVAYDTESGQEIYVAPYNTRPAQTHTTPFKLVDLDTLFKIQKNIH